MLNIIIIIRQIETENKDFNEKLILKIEVEKTEVHYGKATSAEEPSPFVSQQIKDVHTISLLNSL